MERFDAIVVGAGPAGSTAAYRLAGAGARVLLVDRARFPRDKPCGGGLTVRAVRELPVDPTPVVEHVVDRMHFSVRYGDAFVQRASEPLIYMTQRRRLDHFLAESAARAGADFRDGVKVTDVDDRGVRVDGKRIESDAIVAADGVNGISARALGLGGGFTYGVAYEGNVSYEHADPRRFEGVAAINLGLIPGGYGWVFPKGDHVNVGIGGWATEGPLLRQHFSRLCTHYGLADTAVEGLRGYRLPLRATRTTLARGSALAVGDAAGLIDPLSGDGMYESFVSSRLAAEAVLDLLSGRTQTLDDYSEALRRSLDPLAVVSWCGKRFVERFPQVPFLAPWRPLAWRLIVGFVRGEILSQDRRTLGGRLCVAAGTRFAGDRWRSAPESAYA